jgi:hypothetical protein
MPLEPLICRSRYGNVKKGYKNQRIFGESENTHTFAVFKKTKVLTVSYGTLKKKIMDIKKITDELCVEVYATNNEGTTMIIRKVIGEEGVHGTYMNIYYTLMNMEKNVKWTIELFRVRSLKSVYYNVSKEEEV